MLTRTALPSWLPDQLLSLPRVIFGANMLLITGIGVSAAQLTWLLWPDDHTGGITVQSVITTPRAPVVKPAQRAEEVAGLHLFGKADDAAGKAVAAPTANVPETQLNLTLRGVFAVYDQTAAFAIIAGVGGKEQHYTVGAQIPGGVTVKEIHADHVLLSRGGRLETLRLPKNSANFGSDVTTRSPVTRGGLPGTGPSMRPAGGSVSQQLRSYRDRIMSNPMEAMDLVQMQPVTEAGKLKGYRLSPKKDRQLFRQAGLRPGDVVTSVNGIPLSDPANMGQVMSLLSTQSQFNLTVERGGREQNIMVNLNN